MWYADESTSMFTGILVTGLLVCSWAILRLMGGERSRGLQDIKARIRSNAGSDQKAADAQEPVPAADNSIGH